MRQFVRRHGSMAIAGLMLAAIFSISAANSASLPTAAPGARHVSSNRRGAEQPARTWPPSAPGPLTAASIGSEWQPFVPGVLGYVLAMVSTGTDIYVGGHFSQAGSVPANNIARWNLATHQWYALGGGVMGASLFTSVSAILIDGPDLYIGGDFGTAGSVTANDVARWNTTTGTWHSLGNGANNGVDRPVNALARLGNTLFVGGQFQNAGGGPAPGLAEWDLNGQTWSSVGSGPDNGMHGYVYALLVSGTDMYVAGSFDRAGPITTTNIAMWNGGWSSLGLGIGDTSMEVQSLALSGTTLYAGGAFGSASDGVLTTTVNNIAAWSTTQHTWSALGLGVTGGTYPVVIGLALGPQGLYVAGLYDQAGGAAAHNLARWNGSQWSPLADAVDGGEGVDDSAGALSVIGSDVYVGGNFKNAGIRSALGLARWDAAGGRWYALGDGVNSYLTALAVSGDDVYMGGDFTSAGGLPAGHVAHWNRRTNTWSNLNGGVTGCRKTGSTCTTPDVNAIVISGADVYVGGNFSAAGGIPANSLARWDSLHNQWVALGSGVSCVPQFCSPAVNALWAGAGGLIAGGAFDHAGGTAANNIARWNGGAWSSLNGPGNGVNGPVYALVGQGSLVYAGGQFSSPAANLAAFNGSNWSGVGAPLNNLVDALAFVDNDLYVGGQFTNAGGSGADYLAYLINAGGAWQTLSGHVNNPVYTLAAQGSTLIAGGAFTQTGSLVTNHVAEWDSAAASWVALNYGVDATVRALAAGPDSLYMGGDFDQADGFPDFYFTHWGQGQATVSGFAASDPDCLGLFGNYLACAVIGADGHIWLKEFANGVWSQWVRANLDATQGLRSGPSLTGWGAQTPSGRPSQLNVFARGDTNYLLESKWAGGSWSGWSWFPGAPLASSSVDCISWAAPRSDCFYRNAADNSLATATISDTLLLGYAYLGGTFTSGPGVSTWGVNRYDLLARGTDDLLHHAFFDNGWYGFTDTYSGTVSSDPDCVSRADHRVDCVMLGGHSQAMQLTYTGSGWQPYADLGGKLRGGPSIASLGSDNLNVFAWGQDCHFYQRSWTNGVGWSAWFDLGGDARVTGLCHQVFLPLSSR